METVNKKPVNRLVFLGTTLVLLITGAILAFLLYTSNADNEQLLSRHHDFQSQMLTISDSLESKKQELAYFKGRSADLDKLVSDKQTEIDLQKMKIRGLVLKGNATQKELNEMRAMVAQYEGVLKDLNAQITELHAQNEQLAKANFQLTDELASEKNLSSALTAKNESLSKKVEIASLLPVSNIELDAVKKRNNGKDMKVKKARNAEALKITFETGENQVLDAGRLSLYVRIINPKGETIAVNDLGSGTVTESQNGTPMLYTQKADIDWNNANKKVTLYWSENIKTPGTYKVELMQSGYLIGKSQIVLS